MIAVLNKQLTKEGWYDYPKGTRFTVLDADKAKLTLVKDCLDFEHWLKKEDLILIDVDVKKLPKYLNRITASKYAYLKWDFIAYQLNGNDDDEKLIEAIPALKKLWEYAYCAYCAKYDAPFCGTCPLRIKYTEMLYLDCYDDDHPFQLWNHAADDSKEKKDAAFKLLNMISDVLCNEATLVK